MTARDVLDTLADHLGINWLDRPRRDDLFLELVLDELRSDHHDPWARVLTNLASDDDEREVIDVTYRPIETVAIAGGRL